MTTKHRAEWLPSVLAVAGVALLAAVGWWLVNWLGQGRVSKPQAGGEAAAQVLKLFAATDNPRQYKTDPVRVSAKDPLRLRVKQVLDQFAAQAENAEPERWPLPLKVRAVYLRGGGMLVVDFEKPVQYNRAVSAQEELVVVRSLLKTLAVNFPEVKTARFLIGGQESETLAGHIEISGTLSLEDFSW